MTWYQSKYVNLLLPISVLWCFIFYTNSLRCLSRDVRIFPQWNHFQNSRVPTNFWFLPIMESKLLNESLFFRITISDFSNRVQKSFTIWLYTSDSTTIATLLSKITLVTKHFSFIKQKYVATLSNCINRIVLGSKYPNRKVWKSQKKSHFNIVSEAN